MTDRGEPTSDHEYYLELARTLPKIPLDDPRVQAILDARERGDEEAERLARSKLGDYKNNFVLIFHVMRAIKLDPNSEPDSLYRDTLEELGETWTAFLADNSELLEQIDSALEAEEPFSALVRYHRDVVFDHSLPIEKRIALTASLNEAADHPLGIDAIGYHHSDILNPLLERAYKAMETAGIDPLQFC